MQLNFDLCLAQVPLSLPLFILDFFINGQRYEFTDILLYTAAYMMAIAGMISLTVGVKYGMGGIC